MKAPADKSPEPQRQAAAHEAPQQQDRSDAELQFIDSRAETASLRQLQEAADNSPQTQGLVQLNTMMNNSPRSGAMRSLQAMVDNSPRRASMSLQAESGDALVQWVEEDELLQGEFAVDSPAQLAQPSEAKPNNTGLPDNLKAGVESLSGLSLDNVKVHYNSSEPAQLNAHAYAQGTDIHVGPGQEQHLPHEAWHVVQQAQGRVKPTMQMKDGVGVNDDRGLEREADVMGGRAVAGVVQAKREFGSSIESDHIDFQTKVPIQHRAMTAGELPDGAEEDGTGDIFDSRVTEGNNFKVTTELNRPNWGTAIAMYQTTIRDIGNLVAAASFTDVRLRKGHDAPSQAKWGQKHGDFLPDFKGELQIVENSDLAAKIDYASWRDLIAISKVDNRRAELLNRNDIGLIDPFLATIVIEDESGRAPADWKFVTQFADSGAGYIKEILHGGKNLKGKIETREDFNTKKGDQTEDDRGYIYSSTHEQGGETFGARLGQIDSGKDIRGENAIGLDAATWLAAEGARFLPVAALGTNGSPESRYFVKPNDDSWVGCKYYTTIRLMQRWGEDFGKEYGVTAIVMRGVVANGGVETDVAPPAGYHYDLTKGEAHVQG